MSTFLTIIRSFKPVDYSVSTWLNLGVTIRCVLITPLPRNVALLPTCALLIFRILHGYLIATKVITNPIANEVDRRRYTWQISTADGPTTAGSTESIVVLILAASWSHPNGCFSPGSKVLNEHFQAMWRDANENREQYGFLGDTPGLSTQDDRERQDSEGLTQVIISYWNFMERLHQFAHAKVHMKGQHWWHKGAMNKFSHIGIMHEGYEVPAGNWENIYENLRPSGIANTTYPVSTIDGEQSKTEKSGSAQWLSGLRDASGQGWKDMYTRKGRKVLSEGQQTMH